MKKYLKWLRRWFNYNHPDEQNESIILILDTYIAHKCEEVKKYAGDLNIELFFVPAGATDECQPLDIMVFGALKAHASSIWWNLYAMNPDMVNNNESAVRILVKSWDDLSAETIREAWETYNEELEDEDDTPSEDQSGTNSLLSDGLFQYRLENVAFGDIVESLGINS